MNLQHNINPCNEKLRKINMKINTEETNIMVVRREKEIDDIRIDECQIQLVEKLICISGSNNE